MKRLLSNTAVLLCASILMAQEPTWLLEAGNGSPGSSPLRLVMPEADEALYGLGNFGGFPLTFGGQSVDLLGHRDILLVKLDTAGVVQWARSAGSACFKDDNERSTNIAADPNGQHVIITGRFNCASITFGDQVINATYSLNADKGFIASYDSSGNCSWAHGILGFDVKPESILLDEVSSVYLFGGSFVSGAGFQGDEPISIPPGGFVGKYSGNGDLLSAERLMTNGSIYDAKWHSPTEWILSGYGTTGALLGTQSLGLQSSTSDGWVARMDTTGSVVWSVPVLSDNWANVRRNVVGSDGRVFAMGAFRTNLRIGSDTLVTPNNLFSGFIACISATGAIEWVQQISSDVQLNIPDMEISPEGDLYIIGGFKGDLQLPGHSPISASTAFDHIIARFDPATGLCTSAHHFGRTATGYGSLLPTASGLFISGDFDSTMTIGSTVVEPSSLGAHDFLLAKFDSLSGFTGVQHLPVFSEELHIYANPTNGVCTIELPKSLRFTNELVLSVFDNTGQLVQRVTLTTGSEGIKLDIRAQAKGMYHVELGDGEQRYSGSVVFE